jgi:hypothetical protein
VAVGDRTSSQGVFIPEIETLSGGTWTMASVALPGDADQGKSAYVNDVACPASGTCVATGRYTDSSGVSQGLLETLSGGTWTAVKAPLPGGAAQGTKQIGYLTLVACPASGSCLTVGSYTAGAAAPRA